MQELTKEEAIRLHREMWNWIADQVENKVKNGEKIHQIDMLQLKSVYLYEMIKRAVVQGENLIEAFENRWPFCECFCCEYAVQQKHIAARSHIYKKRCIFCPVVWGTEESELYPKSAYCANYLYNYLKDDPRRIANLPEKEGG